MGDGADDCRERMHRYIEGGSLYPESTIKACRRCGEGGLYWQHTEYGWRLFNDQGKMHTCPGVPRFEDMFEEE